MKAIERNSLSSQVVTEIKEYILNNQLKDGDKLPTERDFIEIFGVSRTVIREALKSLEAVGIIQVKPGEGIFVAGLQNDIFITMLSFQLQRDKKSQLEYLDTRLILECGALELCINSLDENSIHTMRDCNMKMRNPSFYDTDRVSEDIRFHQSLFKATKNQIYYELANLIGDFFSKIRRQVLSSPEDAITSANEHDAILDALIEKDLTTAKTILTDHIKRVRKYMESEEN